MAADKNQFAPARAANRLPSCLPKVISAGWGRAAARARTTGRSCATQRKLLLANALASLWVSPVLAAAPKAAPPAPLGSEKFAPSPEQPIGWRGDASGRYPGATPPISWERKTNGTG